MSRGYESPFRQELAKLINQFSLENGSNTPDFILAEYLANCLDAFDKAVDRREYWFGRKSCVEVYYPAETVNRKEK